MWHSLDKNGNISIYDIEWKNGTIERNIPASLLESIKEQDHGTDEGHGVQKETTPVNERSKKKKTKKRKKKKQKEYKKRNPHAWYYGYGRQENPDNDWFDFGAGDGGFGGGDGGGE